MKCEQICILYTFACSFRKSVLTILFDYRSLIDNQKLNCKFLI